MTKEQKGQEIHKLFIMEFKKNSTMKTILYYKEKQPWDKSFRTQGIETLIPGTKYRKARDTLRSSLALLKLGPGISI